MTHITYGPDPDRDGWRVEEHRLDKPVPPRLIARATSRHTARHKARRLAERAGVSWGPEVPARPETTVGVVYESSVITDDLPGHDADYPARVVAARRALHLLDGTIGDLRAALATGEHDDHLDDLEAAEIAGKTRKGAIAAIEGRRAEIAGG